MVAGTISSRMMEASTTMAAARPTPMTLRSRLLEVTKLPNTSAMIRAAAVMTPAVEAKPLDDRLPVVRGAGRGRRESLR